MYPVVFPLSLILDHLLFGDKFADLMIHPSIYHLFIFLLYVYLPTYPSNHPSAHLSVYLPTRCSTSSPICLSTAHASTDHLFIFPSISPPTHSPTCLSILLPIHLLAILYQPTHLTSYPSIRPTSYLLIHPSTCHLPNFSYFTHLSFHLYSHPCIYLLSIHLPAHSLNPTPTYSFTLFQLG